MLIESPRNPLIQQVSLLQDRRVRESLGQILVEGEHAMMEALRAGLNLRHLFVLDNDPQGLYELNDIIEGNLVKRVSEKAMAKLSTTQTPPPCVGVFDKPHASLNLLLQHPHPLVLVLVGLQDPGNVGTLIRSAAAFGVKAVVLTNMNDDQNATDPFSPKVIRSSAGWVFSVPTLSVPLTELLSFLPPHLSCFKTTSHEGQSYKIADYRQGSVLFLGNEGAGLPTLPSNTLTWQTVTIPSNVESLNVAVSGSIILAEAASQRSISSP